MFCRVGEGQSQSCVVKAHIHTINSPQYVHGHFAEENARDI